MNEYIFIVTIAQENGKTRQLRTKVIHSSNEVEARRAIIAKHMSNNNAVKTIQRVEEEAV